MNLDENQRKTVSAWIEEGLKLSEIQKRLAEELNMHLTYMEVRFLMDDLKLQPKDPEPPREPEPEPEPTPAPAAPSNAAAPRSPGTQPPPGTLSPGDKRQGIDKTTFPGDVTVTVDQVTRPGSVVSGQVTFSDGKKAAWYLDQIGRLGIVPEETGYKPSQGDLMIFEGELQNALQKMGY